MRVAQGISHGISRRRFAAAALFALAALAGCAKKTDVNEDLEPRPDPILLHVRNENFLDMNIFVAVGGVQRRLGMVSGNGQADFRIEWTMVNGQPFTVLGQPIGGRGYASTGSMNISPDQMIEFRIASNLRQSSVSVHDRP